MKNFQICWCKNCNLQGEEVFKNDTKSHDNQRAKNIDKDKILKLSEKIGHIILRGTRMTKKKVDFFPQIIQVKDSGATTLKH